MRDVGNLYHAFPILPSPSSSPKELTFTQNPFFFQVILEKMLF